MSKKTAVILFNLGGPDNLQAVKPFLFNLFNDKAIIGAPQPIRWCLAKFISSRREKTAQEIYGHIGNKSPILENTQAQSNALEHLLNQQYGQMSEYKCFISMRYWKPFSYQTMEKVKEYAPDEVILLPLYPQFSTTTTDSSLKDWKNLAKERNLDVPTYSVCYHHLEPSFIKAHAQKILPFVKEAGMGARILFSAHGLPKKIADKPEEFYPRQVEETIEAVVKELDLKLIDYAICYQSRVGPLEWIGPSLDDEMERAGRDKVPVIVVPIAFVSEHSETLVELDIEYKKMAQTLGISQYYRVPTLSDDPLYIQSLANICGSLDEDNISFRICNDIECKGCR